jgi:hypothetical protein
MSADDATTTEQGSEFFYQLEQEHMLAQIISSMPSNRDDMPDVTTPAPIRARWAHRLYRQGVRVHPDLATHEVMAYPSGFAGPHGPRTFQRVDQDKLMAIVQRANPALYERIKTAKADRHLGDQTADAMVRQLLKTLPVEWIEKLGEAGALVDNFAEGNIPSDSPYPHPDAPDPEPPG